ncbi:hypothetical protein HPB49_004685 [Dermacentor silvarum]|uniref:Uncharacterized protein n=1 Tax=Dermacentor silvarum TaxID=543639 RepID=A0ACB8D2Q5_DERSI|nr:hypothetical protein HPB49_004685 [Dermacentor silvarum]
MLEFQGIRVLHSFATQQPVEIFGALCISNETDKCAPPPSKRSTMLLNKLMQPLLKAFKSDAEVSYTPPMELRRRGEGKMFWRCYFNAVSCFRRRK